MTTRTPRAVVIGTGAGGLTAAAYLARRYGFDVVALERGQQFGGFINPFKRKKYEFDPGIHYIGRCRAGEEAHRTLVGIDIDTEEMFAELDPDGFDEYRFGDFKISMCRGAEQYRARLRDAFPREDASLERFFHSVEQLSSITKAMNAAGRGETVEGLRQAVGGLGLARWVRATFAEYLEWAVRDPHLRDVLAAPCGDYGEPPSRASALLGLALFAHYIDGAYFPRGGSRTLRDALVDRAKDGGAEFHRNCEVERIVVRDGQAVAVRTVDGQEFDADVVISAVAPELTLGQFLDIDDVGAKMVRKVQHTVPSPATLCVFLGMKRDLREHGLGAFNIWDYPEWDIEKAYAPLYAGEFPDDPMLFVSPNSLKDPTGSLAPKGSSTLELVTFAPWEMFARWDGMRAMNRTREYVAVKQRLRDTIISSMERRYPGLIGDIDVEEVATPASNAFYVNSPRGSVYGPAATPDQSFMWRFRTASPVPNVFLAGAGVFGAGVVPCLQSGKVAAAVARSWWAGQDERRDQAD